jgi:hypothetical protein
MSANTAPIFPLTPVITTGQVVLTANTAKDGSGTMATLYTAGANGGFVQKVVCQPSGTNTASVARVFINNGLTNATPANNTLIKDATLPATTNSEVAGIGNTEIGLNIAIPPGYKINVAIGTTVAAGIAFSCVAGDY